MTTSLLTAVAMIVRSILLRHNSGDLTGRMNVQYHVLWLGLACAFLSACGGSDRAFPVGGPVTPMVDTAGNPAPATDNGFRLLSNNNGFDLIEGEAITVPVSIARGASHDATIVLSLSVDGNPGDSRLSVSLAGEQLPAGNNQTSLTAFFAHGVSRATEQQRSVVVTASDGTSTESVTMLFNIRPTSLPDIYLLVGQSNMSGFSEDFAKQADPGEPDEPVAAIQQLNVTANDTVRFFSVDQFGNPAAQVAFPDFVEAEDPLHESRDPNMSGKPGTRIGLGLTFAKQALRTDSEHRIVLVPAAWSATGFCNTGGFFATLPDTPDFVIEGDLGWNAFEPTSPVFGGTTLFRRAVVRANLAIQRSGGILRGILWHQGEADSENAECAQEYASNLATLVSEFRTNIITDARGPAARGQFSDVPFVAGTMSRGNDSRGDFAQFSTTKNQVDNIHRTAGSQGLITHYGFANFDDLVPSNGFPCGEGSCVHFGSAAYREMGVRYFQALQSVLSAAQ